MPLLASLDTIPEIPLQTIASQYAPVAAKPAPKSGPIKIRRKRTKKKPPLRIKILKQEAHKADENRRQARQKACEKDLCLELVTKYRITATQKLPFPKILQLTEWQKGRKINELKKRCDQLYTKTKLHSWIIHNFMDEQSFTKITNYFRNEKIASLPRLPEAIDAVDIVIYTLQHSRCVLGAIVWATDSVMEKYDINEENNNHENE